MTYRKPSNRIKWTVYIKPEIAQAVEKVFYELGFYKSFIVEKALEDYLKKMEEN